MSTSRDQELQQITGPSIALQRAHLDQARSRREHRFVARGARCTSGTGCTAESYFCGIGATIMRTERTDDQRNDRAHQQRSEMELPLPQARQTAHPLVFEGPEAVRDSHC
jgi:hypothetical protein